MSSSSLRQHQRRTATTSSGHSPLARNHSLGTSVHHHSSSSSSTQKSNTSLPSPTTVMANKSTTSSSPTSPTSALITATQQDSNNALNDRNTNTVFNFDSQLSTFHNSSIHRKPSETNKLISTRNLCGSIVPLQSSASSPNIDQRPVENDLPNSPMFTSIPLRRQELRYRSTIVFIFLLRFFFLH